MTARPRPMVPITEQVQAILASDYRGQIPAVVVERAVLRMAKYDRAQARRARKRREAQR